MLEILKKLIPNSLANRLFNKYTGHGSWLLLFVMAEQGIISKDAIKHLEGIPNLHVWILICLGVYLILKASKHAPEYFLEKSKIELETEKVELEKMKVEVEKTDFKKANSNYFKDTDND